MKSEEGEVRTIQEEGHFRKKAGFTITPNSVLNDTSLSMGAIGLYAKIQYYITIPNFVLYKKILMQKCKEGKKAFDSRWEELKKTGYLKIYRIRAKGNNYFKYEYELLDVADNTIPAVTNVRITSEEDYSKDEVYNPLLVGGRKGNVSDAELLHKEGSISNTLDNNTVPNNIISINQEDGMRDIHQQEACRLLLESNVEYDSIVEMEKLHIGKEMLDNWISMMVNTIFSSADSFVINQCKVYQSVLASMFKKVERHHLLYAINKYRSVPEEIKNPQAYMRACLWSAIQNQEVAADHAMVKMGLY